MLVAFVLVGFAAFAPSAFAADCDMVGGDLGRCIASVSGKVIATILLFFTGVAGVVLGWIGQLFNWAMLVTVFHFSYYFGNSDGMLLAWGILRDLANIALLFGFIFMGIAVILDLHHFPWKKTLPTLIIYAVLLNFSLFAAEAIIDVSNAVSSIFYAQASGGEDCRNPESVAECANNGLAGKALEATGLASMFSDGSGGIGTVAGFWGESFNRIWQTDDGVMAATLFLGLFVFILITLAIIVSGAIMLISRAVTLMLLLVTSPIGFAGAAIPPLQGMSKQWWEKLMDNVLFAPTFVLLMLIGFKIIEGIRNTFLGDGADGNLVRALLPAEGGASAINTGGVFVLFALVIGFMYAALTVAKKFGIYGSEKVVGAAEAFVGRGAAFGLTAVPAWAGRRTIGTGSDLASRVLRRNPVLASIPLVGTSLQKAATGIADYGAKASFDAKAFAGGKLGKVGDLSKATKGGARGVDEAYKKEETDRVDATVKAQKDWKGQRDAYAHKKWGKEMAGLDIQIAKAKQSGSGVTAAELKALEDQKAALKAKKDKYDNKTKTAFMSGDQKKEYKQLKIESKDLATRIEAAIAAGMNKKGSPGKKDFDAMKAEEALLNGRMKKMEDHTYMERRFDELMDGIQAPLAQIAWNTRGMRLATVEMRKIMGKDKDDMRHDDLIKALKDAAKHP